MKDTDTVASALKLMYAIQPHFYESLSAPEKLVYKTIQVWALETPWRTWKEVTSNLRDEALDAPEYHSFTLAIVNRYLRKFNRAIEDLD